MSVTYKQYLKHIETSMVKGTLKEAKLLAEQRWDILEDHLIKLAIWGDRISWRKEIYAFCSNLQKIEIRLKNRTRLTKMEYLESSDDFRSSTQETKAYFKSRVDNLRRRMTIPMIREYDVARFIVHKIQIELSELLSKGEGRSIAKIDEVLDRYLK